MQTLFALDLGTTKFCIARYDVTDKLQPIDIVSTPSIGMNRGMLSDFQQVSIGINKLLEVAEKKFNTDIRHLIIGVAGSHLNGKKVEVQIDIMESQISSKTVKKLKSEATLRALEPGREILHLIPLKYYVDGRNATSNPIGQSGKKIKSDFFVIDSDQLYLKDIVNAVNQAGSEVLSLYAEPYASSCVTVPDFAKKMGIAVCDIGGGTSDGLVFIDGVPASFFTFNIGGLMMTNDIAIGLNLPFEEAEKAKSYFGLSKEKTPRNIQLSSVHQTKKTITGIETQKILGSRVQEWADVFNRKVSSHRGRLGSGILLTGGGSLTLSLPQFLQHQFKVPVKTTFPSFSGNNSELKFASKYATVIGLLQLEAYKHMELGTLGTAPPKFYFLRNLANWVKELS